MSKEFEGSVLSKGIAIGRPLFLDSEDIFDESEINEKDTEKEIEKFKKALKKSIDQIEDLRKTYKDYKLDITNEILNTHLEILSDPELFKKVQGKIKNQKKSIQTAFSDIILEYKNKIKDPFFKERIKDIIDVFKRISKNLRLIKVKNFKKTKKNIFISNEIIPSHVFELDNKNVLAFVSKNGSYTSHSAIIARSKNIPFLSKIDIDKFKKLKLSKIIVDANLGKIIINPTKEILDFYKKSQSSKKVEKFENDKNFNIFANITNEKEIDSIINKDIKGIGLLRTELLFLEKQNFPNENTQAEIYSNIAKKLKNKPFVIRLFDFGADKKFPYISSSDELDSGYFGLRGVRFLLKHQKLLKDQIKAILKASLFGNIFILIPFVVDIEEITQIKKVLSEVQKELKNKNIKFSNVKIGSMIETPSAALLVEDILKIVDFISIGTNDLTRYTIAKDSFNSNELHPSIEKLISHISSAAKKQNKTMFLCGEIASNKKLHNLFLDLKIENLSMGAKHLS